jgi:hypothetical protein
MERVVWTERRSREAEVIKKLNRKSEIKAKGGKGGEGRAEEVEVQVEVWRKKRKGSSQGTGSAIMETVDSECLRPGTLGLHLVCSAEVSSRIGPGL